MISSFSQYLVEEERVVYFTFGRMNPPTIGHGKLLDALAKKARRNPYKVYLSQSNNPKKDPIPYANKIKHVRKMFPKHGRSVVVNKKAITPFHALSDLYDQGFRQVVMVAGSDRVTEYETRLNKYNGKKGSHGFYNFKGGVQIVSAGQRDADAEGAEGASGTKQRKYAADNNFTGFSQGLPQAMSNADARRLFNDVRKGMGLKEEKTFKNHVQLEKVSERREQYVTGNLFTVSDEVIIKETNDVGTIQVIGSNYVIVEFNGQRKRCWLDAVEKIEEKKLTPNELKKREKVAKAIKRDDPDMPMDKKMAIATAVAKKTAENYLYDYGTDASVKRMKKHTPGQNEGLWDNIHAKRRRGEKMRKKGEKGAPTPDQIKRAQGESTSVRQDPDIKDREGTQPAKYFTGMSKATKAKRDAHFKAGKAGPAPGDHGRKTKPSKFTKYVDKLVGKDKVDEKMNQAVVKAKIDREKKMDAIKHDRMMDRARTADTKRANAKENFQDGKNPERKGLAKRSGVNTKASISDLRKTAKNSTGEKRRMAHWLANMKSGRRKANESLDEASFEDKAKASGISVGTLKKVYQRGVAAWRTGGHRPGTTPSQWGHARVNAFIKKKKQGGLNHDKDLA